MNYREKVTAFLLSYITAPQSLMESETELTNIGVISCVNALIESGVFTLLDLQNEMFKEYSIIFNFKYFNSVI